MVYFNKNKMQVYYTILGSLMPWTQYAPWLDEESPYLQQVENFETGKDYVIYFYAFKPPYVSDASGSLSNAYYLIISEQDDLIKGCEYLYN